MSVLCFQREMLQICTAALLLLLSGFGNLVMGEISDNNFSKCKQFFYKNAPPEGKGITGKEYVPICQYYKGEYHFATLYNEKEYVPLYSAYKVSTGGGQRLNYWMYEPQVCEKTNQSTILPSFKNLLERKEDDPEMKEIQVKQKLKNQADDEDYKRSGYTKGHLNPCMHQGSQNQRDATFTLTNAVPQHKESNTKTWVKYEKKVLNLYNKNCNKEMYVITGAIKYFQKIKKKVSVPEYMWSAYCCPSFTPSDDNKFATYAVMGRNNKNSGRDVVNKTGYEIEEMTLETLENKLQKLLSTKITLFYRHCKK
ncbi:endonuclease domain-containing 1 protein-like [Leuresthes tenuis]|uniref:endonuclease domain-containing 1 protein-like n=1 Tax=Leuresthes tenuis TaxID=355514 RepID=UPI003B50BAB6